VRQKEHVSPMDLKEFNILDSRARRGIPKTPVDRLIETRKENGAGNDSWMAMKSAAN